MLSIQQPLPLATWSLLLMSWLSADVIETAADEVFPRAHAEFQQALEPLSEERIARLRKKAADDPSLLMGAAILAEGSLSRDIQRECIERFPETEKYFLAHELNELEIENKSRDRIRSLASRLTEIDKENSLGHYYLAALAVQNDERDKFDRRLSIILKSQQLTAHLDKYLKAHFSAVDKLDLPFGSVRKVYVIKGLGAGFLAPHAIVRNHLLNQVDELAKEGKTDDALTGYDDTLTLANQVLIARPTVMFVEQYHGDSVSKIMARKAEIFDDLGQTVRAESCRHTARVHNRHHVWMKQLFVRKVTLHRLAYCTHLNAGDLDSLEQFAEQFRLKGETGAIEAAPDLSWLAVPPMHPVTQWNWQFARPKE
jgi:hypothetical protein